MGILVSYQFYPILRYAHIKRCGQWFSFRGMVIQPSLHIDLYDHGLETMRPATANSEMSKSPGFFLCVLHIYLSIYLSIYFGAIPWMVPSWYLQRFVSFLGETSQDRFNSCVRLESLGLLAIFQQLLSDGFHKLSCLNGMGMGLLLVD